MKEREESIGNYIAFYGYTIVGTYNKSAYKQHHPTIIDIDIINSLEHFMTCDGVEIYILRVFDNNSPVYYIDTNTYNALVEMMNIIEI